MTKREKPKTLVPRLWHTCTKEKQKWETWLSFWNGKRAQGKSDNIKPPRILQDRVIKNYDFLNKNESKDAPRALGFIYIKFDYFLNKN